MSVSKALRYQVLRRDNHACRYCGATAPDAELTVDHVIPTALGGSDAPENLVAACRPCNSGKSATPPDAAIVDDVEQSALRWAAAMEAARQALRADRQLRDSTRQTFEQAWNRWTYQDAGAKRTLDLPNSWPTSIDQLAAAGLGAEELAEAVNIAMRAERIKDVFKYFCGVGWRMVEQLQKAARASLDAEAVGEDSARQQRVTVPCPCCEIPVHIDLEIGSDGPPRVIAAEAEEPEIDPEDEKCWRIVNVWVDTVGPDLNAHANPATFTDGELLLYTDSTAWAKQVRILAKTIARRLNEALGENLIQKVAVEPHPAVRGPR